MAQVSTYLNFARSTEAAFEFYRTVFGGEFAGGIHRFRDIPASPDIRVHGDEPLPGHAAGRPVLFTGTHDLGAAITLTIVFVLVGGVGQLLFIHDPAWTIFVVVVALLWLYLLQRALSPYRVLVGLEEVTEWRWTGRRTLPLRDFVPGWGGRYGGLWATRRDGLAKQLDRAQITAHEWLSFTTGGQKFGEAEDTRALGASVDLPPLVLLAVGEGVAPVVNRRMWLPWQTADGTHWRLVPEEVHAAAAGAAIVLVPRTWNDKYSFFSYSEEMILIAGAGADVATVRAGLAAQGLSGAAPAPP